MTFSEERLRGRGQVRLPFDSLAVVGRHTGGVRAAVIAEAVAGDLAATLARSKNLRVPGAEYVQPYARGGFAPEEIGRELNVRGIVLCTVASDGSTVDAAIDLIDVVREELVTHESFLVSSQELIALERTMLRSLADHCRAPRTTTWHPVTADEAVYAGVVKARVALAIGDAEGALHILDGFRAAVPLEIAATIIEGRVVCRIDQAREALNAVRGSVRALQLRATLLSRFDADWLAAEAALREALRIDPASPSTHAMLGDVLLATRRRDEAARHHRVAAQLMPRDERAQIAGSFEHYFGPFPIRAAARLASTAEEFAGANGWLVRSLIAGGDVIQARTTAATPFSRALVAAFTGATFDAAPFGAFERALLFAAAGAAEDAMHSLEQAAAAFDDDVIFAAVEPLFARMTSEPRFNELLSRLGVTQR